jgi:two-component system sensor histidine kinase/response regulator
MVENVLQWARVQQNEIRIVPQRFDIAEVISGIIKINARHCIEKNIAIEFSNRNVWVYADPDTVHVVVRNLIGNAIKFSKEHSTIVIKLGELEGMLKVDISDEGIGIPSEELIRLLESGESILVREGTRGETGSGLGILISQSFIHMNGGKMVIHSNLDIGTVVSFTIPLDVQPHLPA